MPSLHKASLAAVLAGNYKKSSPGGLPLLVEVDSILADGCKRRRQSFCRRFWRHEQVRSRQAGAWRQMCTEHNVDTLFYCDACGQARPDLAANALLIRARCLPLSVNRSLSRLKFAHFRHCSETSA